MRTLVPHVVVAIAVAALGGCADSEGMMPTSVSGLGGNGQSNDRGGDSSIGGSSASTASPNATVRGGAANSARGGADTDPEGTTEPVISAGGGKASVAGRGNASAVNPGKGGASSVSPVVSSGGAEIDSGAVTVGGRGAPVAAAGRSSGGKPAGAGGRGSGGRGGGGAATGGSSATNVVTPTAGAPSFGKKFVGNITTGNSVDTGGLIYSKYWDQITPENQGKWGSVQSSASSSFNWTTLDAIYSYATKNNVLFKEHTFIWGAQQPGGTITEANVKNWMSEFCKRYPETAIIDVVNEPPPHTTPSYANNIGGGTNGDWKWIANAFKWAREACPNAILVLNDYNNIEWSTDNGRFIDIVKKIKALDAPIDAVGAQSHDLDHGSVSLNTVKTLLAKLHDDTGLPVYITEMDISNTDDAAQLKLYQQYFPLFMDSDYVKGITIWGWIYGQTWSQAPNSGLVRSGKSRTAMTYLMGELGRPAP